MEEKGGFNINQMLLDGCNTTEFKYAFKNGAKVDKKTISLAINILTQKMLSEISHDSRFLRMIVGNFKEVFTNYSPPFPLSSESISLEKFRYLLPRESNIEILIPDSQNSDLLFEKEEVELFKLFFQNGAEINEEDLRNPIFLRIVKSIKFESLEGLHSSVKEVLKNNNSLLRFIPKPVRDNCQIL